MLNLSDPRSSNVTGKLLPSLSLAVTYPMVVFRVAFCVESKHNDDDYSGREHTPVSQWQTGRKERRGKDSPSQWLLERE